MAADEQIIYLSPEEDVTSVHERLERIPARRILLVVPPQTTLRSLTSWRVLRSYARELNKEVLVVTSDRQIRSVAKEAQFRVANSLESPPSNKGRSSSDSSRSGISRIALLRGQSNRGGVNRQRTRQPQGPAQNAGRDPGAPASTPRPPLSPRPPLPPSQPIDEQRLFAPGEMEEDTDLGAPASSFGRPEYEERFAPPIDFRVSSSSHLHPVEDEPEQEDEGLHPFGYQQSQEIWQAWPQKDKPENEVVDEESDETDTLISPPGAARVGDSSPNSQTQRQPESWLPAPATPVDPFAQMDDGFQPLPLSEQRGEAMNPVHEFHDGEDVADIPPHPTADIQAPGNVEDLGDIRMDDLPPLAAHQLRSSPFWEEEEEDAEEPEEVAPPSYIPRMRSGTLSPRAMEADTDEEDDEEDLPSFEDQPTRCDSTGIRTSRRRNRLQCQPDVLNQSARGEAHDAYRPNERAKRARSGRAATNNAATLQATLDSNHSAASNGISNREAKRPAPRPAQRKPAARSQKKRPVNWVTPVVIIGCFPAHRVDRLSRPIR